MLPEGRDASEDVPGRARHLLARRRMIGESGSTVPSAATMGGSVMPRLAPIRWTGSRHPFVPGEFEMRTVGFPLPFVAGHLVLSFVALPALLFAQAPTAPPGEEAAVREVV